MKLRSLLKIGGKIMEYIIERLTKREIDIMESSDIEWCPDDMSGDNTDIVVFNENDCDKALHLIGRKWNYLKRSKTKWQALKS
mgnify:CR=1 FL=1